MKRPANIITLILLGFSHAFCGVHDIRFSHIGIDKGLSHSTVNGISQDSSGYIWIATPDGINRYDGYKFTTMTTDSLDHNVRSVAADAKGNIWAVTAGKLSTWSTAAEAFDGYAFPQKTASLTTLQPFADDMIAVGSTDGLYIFDPRKQTFTPIDGTAGFNITAMAPYNDRTVVFGTADGKVAALADGRTEPLPSPGKIEINTLLRHRDALLIGTEGAGLFACYPEEHRLRRIAADSGIDYVRSLLTDTQGRIWAGTFTGLFILDPEEKKVVFHEDATAPDGALSHSSVRRIFSDNQGGIWLGTYFGGLNYYHPRLNQFTTLSKHSRANLSISGNIAGPMAEDSRGNIWIGTNNGGLNIYNPETGSFRKYSRAEGLGSDDVKAIFIDEKNGRAYVGTHIGGLTVIDLKSGRVGAHPEISQSVYDILPAQRGERLWLATLEGISLLDPATLEAHRVQAPAMPSLTTNLMRDSKGRLWVSGEDGLAVYQEHDDGSLEALPGLPRLSHHINDVFQSRTSGHFWIASHRGLMRYDEATGKTTSYSVADGLPGDIVYALLEDPNANIWATTNRGLACLNPGSGTIRTYAKRGGLRNSQFTDRSALHASNGLMYFGGINGVTYFNPTILETNTYAPTPLIEGLRLFNKPVVPGDDSGILSVGIRDTKKLVFDASQTNFTIDFTTCDYISEGANTFRYMLDGIDREWVTPPPGVRSVSYSNLPSGKYTFRLKAANNDGVWSDGEATIDIEILPPWYLTWWAIVLMTVLLLAAAFVAVRYVWRRKSLEKMQKAQQEVNEMKVRFFVNMSHELRTPLTLMLLPITELLDSKPDPVTLQKLTTIRNNTLRIRHIVNQLLDYRRAELGMFRLSVASLDINEMMNDLLEPYRSLADKKHIRFNFNSTVASPAVYADANYLELIVNNLVTNAFKYTPDGGEITVDLTEEADRLTLSVADTGCGIPPDKLSTIFTRFYQLNDSVGGYGIGLSLVKRLVELHHGTISVSSTVGKGSTFTVTIPVNAAAYSAAETGTAPMKRDSRNEDISALLPLDEDMAQPESPDGDTDGRKTVMVVDDNAEILKYLSKALSRDFRVLTAANGTKAIEILSADTVDLVISDVMMPDMDGVQLCRAIKRNLRTSHIPVILLSAKADVADRLDGLKVGADDYIAKPFQMDELLAKVRNQLHTRESIIRHYSQNAASTIEPSKVAQNPLDEEFLEKAVKIMNDHIDDSQFTTDEFARRMCMSRSNLHLKMKALTGESTNDFIRRTRMRKAAEMLKTRRYTVAEVSAMVGYSTPSYFATAFKNFFGHSPSSLLAQQ